MAALVTIAIPAYSERFFGEALASALAQAYSPLEILVCDDSPGSAIEAAVRASADPRVRYLRNPQRLGFAGNFTRCFREANGELMKFLNDDDRLLPGCVETLARVLEATPAVMLATSRRTVVDSEGRALPDSIATRPVALASALIAGREMGDLALAHSVNLIGEPTTVMFRRAQLEVEGDSIFRWGGRDYHCLADLAAWLRLMRSGFAYYCATPLSQFRMHEGQEQDAPGVMLSCLLERLWILRQARACGFLQAPNAWRAALAAVRERAQPWVGARGEMDAATRATIDGFIGELEAEIAAAKGGP